MSGARFTCFDCGAHGPTEAEEVTRASSLGWRLRLLPMPDGTQAPQWRCPRCWVAFKVKEGSQSYETSGRKR